MTNGNRLQVVFIAATFLAAASAGTAAAQTSVKPRAQELGITQLIGGTPGALNAITDVAGVEVGHTTLISGNGSLKVGEGPVRTGVTIVHPRGRANPDPVFGSWFTLNGYGEMTGTTWLTEGGFLEGPIGITNTHSVGIVRDAIIKWQAKTPGQETWGLPVVAETYDGGLNDINGFHVTTEHAIAAIEGARGGVVQEGNVGGGTGMECHGFKGGIGTASRRTSVQAGGYTVGVLVQCNYGSRPAFAVAGVPVGLEITDLNRCTANADTTVRRGTPRCAGFTGAPQQHPSAEEQESGPNAGGGSIIIIVATDAPLLPHQLKRIATRAALGVGRMGGRGENSSGDIFVTFSTANPKALADSTTNVQMLANSRINPLFIATIQATEEAIVNALLAADTMTGADDLRVYALPHDRLAAALRKYNRLPGQ